MSKVMTRKTRLVSLFKFATNDDAHDGEDVYDYSDFIKKNFYNPSENPDLKIDIQDSDQEIVEEFDGVLERLEILIEHRVSDEDTQPHDFMDFFKKELQDMVSKFDDVVIENTNSELEVLYNLFRQYLGMYEDYKNIVASAEAGMIKRSQEEPQEPSSDGGSEDNVVIRPETMDSIEVGHIQAMLAHLGYDLGRTGVDGDFGRKTFKAVRDFQRDNNIPSSGIINSRTADLLREKAPDVAPPSSAQILSGTSRGRIFERTRTEDEASADVSSAMEIISEISNSGSFSSYSGGGDMSNLSLRRSVRVEGMDQKVMHLLGLINEVGKALNTDVLITSGFRTPADQSSIMFFNWNRKGGVGRGSAYLLSLYRRFRRIDEMAEIFERADLSDDQKRNAVEQIITDAWQPFRGHLDGLSLDVSFRTGKYKVGVILSALQELGIIRLLEEDDHYHITAKDVPSPTQRSMV